MSKVSIDREKCIGCESCVKDCITYSLEMSENKAQVAEGGDERCISCQHCFAICPTGVDGVEDSYYALKPEEAFANLKRMKFLQKIGIKLNQCFRIFQQDVTLTAYTSRL